MIKITHFSFFIFLLLPLVFQSCTSCLAGKFASSRGLSSCSVCPSGTVAKSPGASSCSVLPTTPTKSAPPPTSGAALVAPPTLLPTLNPASSSCTAENLTYIGDGWCDSDLDGYNVASCGFDGGDCCPSMCNPNALYPCGVNGYSCIDPTALGCNVQDTTYIGDGWCDHDLDGYNVASCGFDGGDCCASMCNPNALNPCGVNGYSCIDPTALSDAPSAYPTDLPADEPIPEPITEPTQEPSVESCQVEYFDYIGDGWCDSDLIGYNTALCGYDGGILFIS